MLQLVLFYFIGRKYYELADEYEKSKWVYAVLGVAIYFIIALVLGVVLGLIIFVTGKDFLSNTNNLLLEIIYAPFGILGCYLLYMGLEKKWKKELPNTKGLIEEIGKVTTSDQE